MPSLFRRSNGIYYYVVVDPSGKRRWMSTGEKRKSLALAKIQASPSAEDLPKASPSLDSFIPELLAYVRNVFSPSSPR